MITIQSDGSYFKGQSKGKDISNAFFKPLCVMLKSEHVIRCVKTKAAYNNIQKKTIHMINHVMGLLELGLQSVYQNYSQIYFGTNLQVSVRQIKMLNNNFSIIMTQSTNPKSSQDPNPIKLS